LCSFIYSGDRQCFLLPPMTRSLAFGVSRTLLFLILVRSSADMVVY
jgi:hypothetical protein